MGLLGPRPWPRGAARAAQSLGGGGLEGRLRQESSPRTLGTRGRDSRELLSGQQGWEKGPRQEVTKAAVTEEVGQRENTLHHFLEHAHWTDNFITTQTIKSLYEEALTSCSSPSLTTEVSFKAERISL